jgi:hypothetical protein
MKCSVTLRKENFMINMEKTVFVRVVAAVAASMIFSISSEWEVAEVVVRNKVGPRK